MSRLFPNSDARLIGSKRHGRPTPHENGDKRAKAREDPSEASLRGFGDPLDSSHSPPGGEPSESEHMFSDEGAALDLAGARDDLAEVEQLRVENAQLRALVADLEKQIEEIASQGGLSWEEQQKEYESLLEEKSEVIRTLHRKIQELQERPSGGAAPREQELLALSEELERERRQLKEDEESLMQQMREMEVQMSRERAEMARQRNEVLRLQSEVRHELEMASRDAALRERLAPLQRRHQELTNRRGSGPPPPDRPPPSPQPAPPPAAEAPRAKKDSGLFSRLFGQGGQ